MVVLPFQGWHWNINKTFSSEPCNFWRLFQYKLIFLCFGWRMCELGSSRVYLKDFFLLSDKTFWSPFKHPAQSCSTVFNFIIFTPSFSLKMSKAHIPLELLKCSTGKLQEHFRNFGTAPDWKFKWDLLVGMEIHLSAQGTWRKVRMMFPESAFV